MAARRGWLPVLVSSVAALPARAQSPSAARPRGVVFGYAPTGPHHYRFADVERVERSFSTTLPAEVHRCHTDWKDRWQVTARGAGLAVKIEVLSSVLQLDRTTAPRDLGGQVGVDLIAALKVSLLRLRAPRGRRLHQRSPRFFCFASDLVRG